MSSPVDRILADLRVRVLYPANPTPDGVGHPEWAEQLRDERRYFAHLVSSGPHPPTWADHLRLRAVAALAATDARTLRRELLDLGGVTLGWVEDLDTRIAFRERPGSAGS